MILGHEYDLFRDNILDEIKESEEKFIKCMAGNYLLVAEKHCCDITVNSSRLKNAYTFWNDDIERTLESGIQDGSPDLDCFKQAAFLTFWLRRFHPLEHVNNAGDRDDAAAKALRDWFAIYGNEIVAITIGLHICQNYSLMQLRAHEKGENIPKQRGLPEMLSLFEYTHEFMIDFATILKHKNNSPHAIALIYRALFTGIYHRTPNQGSDS